MPYVKCPECKKLYKRQLVPPDQAIGYDEYLETRTTSELSEMVTGNSVSEASAMGKKMLEGVKNKEIPSILCQECFNAKMTKILDKVSDKTIKILVEVMDKMFSKKDK